MDQLEALRNELTAIDSEIFQLFARRLAVVDQVSEHKLKMGIPVYVPVREGVILARARSSMPQGQESYGEALARTLLRLSRERQYARAAAQDSTWALGRTLQQAEGRRPAWYNLAAVEGEAADGCGQVFPKARIMAFGNSATVAAAVSSGEVDAAVLPYCKALELAAREGLYIQAGLDGEERYLVVGKEFGIAPRARQVSILVKLAPEPDSLALVVSIFVDLNLPISSLHCMRVSAAQQLYYVEFASEPGHPQALQALYQLEREAAQLSLLGWYPVFDLE